jgi:hypothetical protein
MDWEYSGKNCPKCHAGMRERMCDRCDGEGFLSEDPDDWEGFGPQDGDPCGECARTGWEIWCGECGWDETFKQFMSPDYQAAWEAKQPATTNHAN